MNIVVLIVLFAAALSAQEDDWTNQCNKCNCTWAGGKKTANCTSRDFSDIPQDLSREIRDIDFSYNSFIHLKQKVFFDAYFRDIHKIKMQSCGIESLDVKAFAGLRLLIELDLSRNSIKTLWAEIFKDNKKLRIVNLSHNKITRLEDYLFYNMTQLQQVFLSHNKIESFGEKTFVMLEALQRIDLNNNSLKHIANDFTVGLPRLGSLHLEENPWVCDCHLQAFRNKTVTETLITTPTECAEPFYMRGKTWNDRSTIFGCAPEIIEPPLHAQIEAVAENVTLYCKVLGEPQPDVDWVSLTRGRIIDRDPQQSHQRFIAVKGKLGQYTWNNLTIVGVTYRDKGEYKCLAKNPVGEDERNISLKVPNVGTGFGGFYNTPITNTKALLIGLSCGTVVLLLLILILVCCCFRRKSQGVINSKRRDMSQTSTEYIGLQGQPEIKQALITDVNPVLKPPRATLPNSVTSEGTEVSETKKNLLDSDSIYTGDDESRSLDLDHPLRRSQNLLDTDYRLHHPYPPDLLSFPPRSQISPAGSSASTVADTSRLPAHHGPQSPMSPVYDQLLYRTLPYSRSQTQFPSPQPRVPRQGYVTIPRRPRQSWSSEPPPSGEEVAEPVYDNLGVRTTADGSSALSLNKIGVDVTPRSSRPVAFCVPISELEPLSSTLPRKLSPSRTEWARANAEALRSPDKRNSMSSVGEKKVPPKPPPKPPKKRMSTGPLFEDEGEDGTEV